MEHGAWRKYRHVKDRILSRCFEAEEEEASRKGAAVHVTHLGQADSTLCTFMVSCVLCNYVKCNFQKQFIPRGSG